MASNSLTVPAWVRWTGACASWFVMLTVGATLLVALIVPRLAGATPYVVLTGSMQPKMPPGTLVVARPVDPMSIAPGDVVTYQIRSGDPQVVTHRVITQGIDLEGRPHWRTQGDANTASDEGWVQPEQVRGRRWYFVPYIGYVTSFVTDRQRESLMVVGVTGLLGYAGVMFLGALLERLPRRRRAEASS